MPTHIQMPVPAFMGYSAILGTLFFCAGVVLGGVVLAAAVLPYYDDGVSRTYRHAHKLEQVIYVTREEGGGL